MRTTVNFDDHVLLAVKSIAARRRLPLGKVLSDLVRQALEAQAAKPAQRRRHGVELFQAKPGGRPVDLELVNRMRDESP